jgi:hypothetical protein
MRVMSLVRARLFLAFFVTGLVLLVPGLPYAGHKCCSASYCYMYHCSCPGQGTCPFRSPYQETLLVQEHINSTVDIRVVRMPADPTMYLTQVGSCARREFALRILGNNRDHLMVQEFDEVHPADNSTTVRVAATIER